MNTVKLPLRRVISVTVLSALFAGSVITTSFVAQAEPVTQSGDALQVRVAEELDIYAAWLEANNAQGYIGEFGWPGNLANIEEQQRWNRLGEAYYRNLDQHNLPATIWATGSYWGDYVLSVYQKLDVTGNGSISIPQAQASVVERHPSTDSYMRGIQVAGGSFGMPSSSANSPYSNVNPGTLGNDYFYDSQETFNYLASRGHEVVRIDFTWERLQPTLGGPLDPTALQQLQQVVARADTAGLKVILDLHNYGAYYLHNGTEGVRTTLGQGLVSNENFAQLWTELSDAFADNDAVVSYGLMNEPHDIASSFTTQQTFYDFETTSAPWNTSSVNASVSHTTEDSHSGTGAMQLSNNFTTENNIFIKDDVGDLSDNSAQGTTFSTYIYLPEGAQGSYTGLISIMNASYQYIQSPGTTLQPGAWNLVTFTPPSSLVSNMRGLALTISGYGTPNETIDILIDDIHQGDATSGLEVWQTGSQQALSAIRANGDTKEVFVSGYNWSGVRDWTSNNPTGWITDPANNFRYEAHHYFDCQNNGFYDDTYQESRTCAEQAGFAATGTGAPVGELSFNQVESSSQVSIGIVGEDDLDVSGQLYYRASQTSDFTDASWQPFSSLILWDYIFDTPTTVYVQLADTAGNESEVYQATFTVNSVPTEEAPEVIEETPSNEQVDFETTALPPNTGTPPHVSFVAMLGVFAISVIAAGILLWTALRRAK